jgi:hypothetical protein
MLVVVFVMTSVLVGSGTATASTDYTDLCVASTSSDDTAASSGGTSGGLPHGPRAVGTVGTPGGPIVLASTGAGMDIGVWVSAAITMLITGLAIILVTQSDVERSEPAPAA